MTVSGVVQGVGFRPFVCRLAQELGLDGHVLNRAGAVEVEVEGSPTRLDAFLRRLRGEAPKLAAIEGVSVARRPPRGECGFRILASEASAELLPFIAPDVATCDECLRELFDPADRRFEYPFINCTACGPRLTIVEGVPYDRERTTMRRFALCAECRAEYEDPSSRRFHAQPNACPRCGPSLVFYERGAVLTRGAALERAVERLTEGAILAIKGIGGFHLACDAQDEAIVTELRARKRRPHRPFALMVESVERAAELVHLGPEAQALLCSPERPIVLLCRRAEAKIADAVAPSSPELGVMLPYTPLHHLLLRRLRGKPLVMTSGNVSGEPIAIDEVEAVEQLGSIADAFLSHDRPIRVRCDDSVARVSLGVPRLLRRARGHAPRALRLPRRLPRPALAVGADLETTFALGRDQQAFVSQHLGDLEHLRAQQAFEDAVIHYEKLFAVAPEVVVHDAHPDYASTRFALKLAHARGLERVAVQHHEAHIASCLAEHGVEGPVIGVAFDGTGHGSDGTIWGGEFFVGEGASLRRVGHLRAVPLPGGDSAVREPWRMAVAYLHDAGAPLEVLSAQVPQANLERVRALVARHGACPRTSSAGRLFDAVSAIAGVCLEVSYEGQAAIELEWASPPLEGAPEFPFELERDADQLVVDTRPLVRGVVEAVLARVPASEVARRFHATLASATVAVCEVLRAEFRLQRVALGGGVFANTRLSEELERRLGARGFELFRPSALPPGDGGISLGQLVIAGARSALEGRA